MEGGDTDVVDRFFAALEAGDFAGVEALYHPEAVMWLNDGTERDVAGTLTVLKGLHAVVDGLRYEVARRHVVDGGVVQQHALCGRLPDGTEVRMPAAMYLEIADGRVRRIEEYLDSAHAAPIRAARGA
ncbi:ketosteroid isomerase-like protein [Actinomycetospora succinea]|uniref:Ketosteroid isomerase-like protein n=1 Tax=Actinomycetospora succinea TaxID=663603 RepID=A0A4R6UXW8_9PSEU|nr:nuclear transport factor 2 family protein [Actinomycetospora succinea]TDQ50879.1 ketosteroid isomerase-like protein [Actinomycetospora succinea]